MRPCRPASRPGGGNAVYPTTGAASQQQGYTSGKWPSTYEPDRVLSYELGEKARMLDRRLTVNASIYYEDWRHVQLEAYPNDWALNINGNYVHIYGADIDILADLGAGFQLEVAAGYLYEYLDGGLHWVITPVHKMPEVAPESGTLALNYSKALSGSYTFTARLENTYTGPRYSIFFSDPYEFTGTYRQLPGYDLINVRAGVKFHDKWSATAFVNNLTNKRAQLESMFTENEPQPSLSVTRKSKRRFPVPLLGKSFQRDLRLLPRPAACKADSYLCRRRLCPSLRVPQVVGSDGCSVS